MMRKITNKKKIELFIFAIAFFQIAIMLNSIPAESYFIGSAFENQNAINIKNDKKYFSNLLSGFLISFFSIKQIGIVSATPTSGLKCCRLTIENAICQEVSATEDCSQGLYATTCEATAECKVGTCIINDGESCSENSPKYACEISGGDWDSRGGDAIPECRKGGCVIGSNAQFTTAKQCQLLGGTFSSGITSEAAAIMLSQNIYLIQGACVLGSDAKSCRFVTSDDCENLGGDFYQGFLCSNPLIQTLGVNCQKQASINCASGKSEIYWFDSCGNTENIYSSDKDESWNNGMVLNRASSCGADSATGNANSLDCGNCNPFSGSICAPTATGGQHVADGNFICRDLGCEYDSNKDGDTNDAGDKKRNGESWCVYEGSIGNRTSNGDVFASDTIGSEHRIAKCINGRVEINVCGSGMRTSLCQEKVIEEDTNSDGDTNDAGEKSSSAQCVVNQANLCRSFNPLQSDGEPVQGNIDKCNENLHCMIKNVNVDSYFSFSVCVPRYPTGSDLRNPGTEDSFCAAATAKCTVIYQKNEQSLIGGSSQWSRKANANCLESGFPQQMNNLCVSMGDCGTYTNFIGNISKNSQISVNNLKKSGDSAKVLNGFANFNWNTYKIFANTIPGLKVPPVNLFAPTTVGQSGEIPEDTTDIVELRSVKGLFDFFSHNEQLNRLFNVGSGGGSNAPNQQSVINMLGPGATAIFFSARNYFAAGGAYATSTELTAAQQSFSQVSQSFTSAQSTLSNALASADSAGAAEAISGAEAELEAAGENYLQSYGELQTAQTEASSSSISISWGALAAAAVGSIIGAYVGSQVAQQLGVSGPAAEAMTVAGGVAGGAYAAGVYSSSGSLGLFAVNPWTVGIALAVMVWIAASGWGTSEKGEVRFSCLPWQAPTGSKECSRCNDRGFACTKYECESLGQGCILLNENSDAPTCQSIAYETNPPVIRNLTILTEGYKFTGAGTEKSTEIKTQNDLCVPENTLITFKLNTSEFSQCKWSSSMHPATNNFESMTGIPMEGTDYSKNHTFGFEGISLTTLDSLDITGDEMAGFNGTFSLFVRCQDYHGNYNIDPYSVNICVSSEPDRTAPLIVKKQPESGATLAYGLTETDFAIWTNEPSDCSYSLNSGLTFEQMESAMDCKNEISERDIYGYLCDSTLTNLVQDNKIYIKCKDKPWETDESNRNANVQDTMYQLKLTQTPLTINSIAANVNGRTYSLSSSTATDIIGGGSDFNMDLTIGTSGGVDHGNAICSYKFEDTDFSEALFFNTGSNIHRQTGFGLQNGNYNVSFSCVDDVNNIAESSAPFNLNIDSDSPLVVRAFKEGGRLTIQTNEMAKCAYGLNENYCSERVRNGSSMTTGFSKEHSATWESWQNYYIKCEDIYNNENSDCAIIVRPESEIQR